MPKRTNKTAASTPTTVRVSSDDVDRLAPTGIPRIVNVEGITGIFTPVTNKLDTPLTDDERRNFQSLIGQLTKQVASLKEANATLSQQLDELRNPPHSPEAFNAAIQQALDELQQKLTTMKNPMSNFALKDFHLDANVMIDVSRLGTIEYRFIRPGDSIDSNAVSRISIDLVPVPKAGLDHTWTPDAFQPDLGVDALPAITSEQTKVLQTNQIFTIGDFLQVGTRARAVTELVALLRIDRDALAEWLKQAELLTLRGTNGATILVLMAAGYPSLDAIAHTTPEALLAAYLAARKKQGDSRAVAATLEDVTQWIAASRRYVGLRHP